MPGSPRPNWSFAYALPLGKRYAGASRYPAWRRYAASSAGHMAGIRQLMAEISQIARLASWCTEPSDALRAASATRASRAHDAGEKIRMALPSFYSECDRRTDRNRTWQARRFAGYHQPVAVLSHPVRTGLARRCVIVASPPLAYWLLYATSE